MRVLPTALFAAIASLCGAHVEKQFKLPDFLRQPFYDVEMSRSPLAELDSVSPDRVVSINHGGHPLKCVLPATTTNATLEPLTDEDAISQARAILRTYKETSLLHLDDVWGWNFQFDDNIVQFFPQEGPEPGVFQLSSSSFQVYIGRNDDAPGHVSLDDAEPVIVDDQYMLYTRFVNGTQCDLTLEPRAANVFFVCSPQAAPEQPTLLSIDEPYSCTYEFVIGLNELCDIEAFQKPKLPVNTIRCGIDPEHVLEEPDSGEPGLEYNYVDLGAEQLDDLGIERQESVESIEASDTEAYDLDVAADAEVYEQDSGEAVPHHSDKGDDADRYAHTHEISSDETAQELADPAEAAGHAEALQELDTQESSSGGAAHDEL